jgi:hypothetical protein
MSSGDVFGFLTGGVDANLRHSGEMFPGYIHTVLFFVFGRLIFCSGGKFVIFEEDFETSKKGSGLERLGARYEQGVGRVKVSLACSASTGGYCTPTNLNPSPLVRTDFRVDAAWG